MNPGSVCECKAHRERLLADCICRNANEPLTALSQSRQRSTEQLPHRLTGGLTANDALIARPKAVERAARRFRDVMVSSARA
jgi:hypothetical protein